jgi:hypothetical protein
MSTIIFIIVLLHLLVGFGYVVYKLQPQKKKIENNSNRSLKKDS